MPRIVILGAGFGGLFAAKRLAGVAADVTVVDRHNYHLFQPLLYQVATAGLPPSDIAWPIRSILSRQKNTSVLLAEVIGIDVARHEVILKSEAVAFDYLIVATGSTHSYFGHEDWETTRGLGTPVTHCDGEGVTIGGDRIAAATIIWAAGVAASPAGRWLDRNPTRSAG
ncbi:MAG: FAD-dependent oxidoreductase [Proteobacteria bacterium]|nr:FAD-dependent oxidoreductase [Pseudomonadota bacterium]